LFRKHADAAGIATDKVNKYFPVSYPAGGKINIGIARVKFKLNTAWKCKPRVIPKLIKQGEMDGVCSTYEGEETCRQGFSGET